MSATIVTGDDVAIPVTLKKDGATFAIDTGATIKAAVISTDHKSILSPIVTLSSAATGADWANSLVIVEMTSANTAAIVTTGSALLEIEVNDSGKLTWFASVVIIKGNVE